MNKADKYYLENLNKVLLMGSWDENPRPRYKDGKPAFTKFITQVFETYDISSGEFPIPTIRNTAIKTGIKEVLWIYQKQSNSLKDAHEMGINWWDEWDIGDGTIGQRYGATVKRYNLIDNLLEQLKLNPFGRRHLMELYQYNDMKESKGLDPCAHLTEWSVRKIENDYFLDLTLIQRSQDYLMASHINKIQYVALQMMIASHLGYRVGKFCHFIQNLHIYDRHLDALKELLARKTLDRQPIIKLKENKSFYEFTIDDFIIEGIEGIEKLSKPLEIAI